MLRYRIRGQIEHPFTIRKAKFTGFVWTKSSMTESTRLGAQQVRVGTSHVFNKHFTLDLYLMRQNDGRTRPGDITILGSNMRFRM